MLVLLDEMISKRLAGALPHHVVRTVRQMGWDGRRNGDLMRVAVETGFGALITADRNLEFQQDLSRCGLAIVVLVVRSTAPERILPLAPHIVEVLAALQPGQLVHVETHGRG